MKLLIGNKNYSSWSLRPWLLLRQAEIPFEEEALSFNAPDFKERVRAVSPAGKVPVLIDGDVVVRRDVARVIDLWSSCRAEAGAAGGGPFLFGRFTIPDAYFAPVVRRFA